MFKGFTPRLYQETILATAARHNTLVVLPTGLGKTAVAALLAAQRLSQYPKTKIVFLAPTRPLVQQHLTTFKNFFDFPDTAFALLTGQIKPEKRITLWQKATFIFSTPQGLENDVLSRKISLENVSLLIVDEAHRAIGDYAYVFLTQQYTKQSSYERILALTASPGSKEEIIREVCQNLFVEKIEARSIHDPDVSPYVQDIDVEWMSVDLTPTQKKICDLLKQQYMTKISEAFELGYLRGKIEQMNKITLLAAQNYLQSQTARGEKTLELLRSISLVAEALKIQHALELAETQTLYALSEYFSQLVKQAETTSVKAVQRLVSDSRFITAKVLVEEELAADHEHPKLLALNSYIDQNLLSHPNQKMIIFTQYRDTAQAIKKSLVPLASAEVFVGQMKKKGVGLSQKDQKLMLDRFRNGDFQVLIATSVAEEGLDIPAVDLVIFYEPIPSAIRTVQRRGRTARHAAGKVLVFVAKGTRDEAYRWSAHHKEKRMYRALTSMKNGIHKRKIDVQQTLSEKEELFITADYREKGSAVLKTLVQSGVKLQLEQMPVGDYKITDDVIVEYKTVKDFVDSIIDGRLLSQLRALRNAYKPLLIIEGTDDFYAQRKISPESIRGMLATIALSYHIPLLRTQSAQDTAGVLQAIAKREQHKGSSNTPAPSQKPWSLREQQEYLVASLPGIGSRLAKPLLKHFGSVKAIFEASIEDLKAVPLIGETKAQKLRNIIESVYTD